MRSILVAGLDVGSACTRAVVGELLGDQYHPTLGVLGIGRSRTVGVRRDVVTDLEAATECIRATLREAEVMAGVRLDRVYLGVSGDHISVDQSSGVVAVAAEEIVPRDIERVHEVAQAVALPQRPGAAPRGAPRLPRGLPRGHHRPRGHVRHPPRDRALPGDRLVGGGRQPDAGGGEGRIPRAGARLRTVGGGPVGACRGREGTGCRDGGPRRCLDGDIRPLRGEDPRHRRAFRSAAPPSPATSSAACRSPSRTRTGSRRLQGCRLCRAWSTRRRWCACPGSNGRGRSVPRTYVAQLIEQRLENMLRRINRRLHETFPQGALGAGIVLTGGVAATDGDLRTGPRLPGCSGANRRSGRVSRRSWRIMVARPGFATATGLALHGADRFLETGDGASTVTSGLVTRMGAWLREFF